MSRNIPNPKANKSILIVIYSMIFLFVGMLGYFGWFLQVKSEDTINNSYNARLDHFEQRIVRGEILGHDGRVLAQTIVSDDGSERRNYPYDSLFAHVVGYSTQGKTGIEALGNYYLLSSHVNLAEKTINEISGIKNPGDRIITTLDVDLQQTAADALGGRKGAVVVMEPDTGKVLAMVSNPGFNPNTIQADWEALIAADNKEAQLLNRAAQGVYPPGSTFKIITALQYIREHPDDYQDYTFDCSGVYEYEGYRIRCFKSTAHGHQNLTQAFANSCNGAFSNLGLTLDAGKMNSLAGELLFNTELPLAIAYSKSSYNMDKGADTWEVLQTSIGQGTTQMSPIHNAMLTAAIANGGTLMKPYFIDRVESVADEEVKKFLPEAYGNILTAQEAQLLSALMRSVVTEGTGSAVRTDAYTVAAKTGSAEFETGKETHAWFTGYAPAENPQLVVTVIVEESGSGGQVAAPVARSIFDRYFAGGS